MLERRVSLAASSLLVLLALPACDDTAPATGEALAPGSDLFIGDKRFSWVRSVPRAAGADLPPAEVMAMAARQGDHEAMPTFDPAAQPTQPGELSERELAESLRARVLVDGQEYLAAEPDHAAAAALKHGIPAYALPDSEPAAGSGLETFRGALAGVTDNRYPVSNTSFPGRTHLYLVFDCAGSADTSCIRTCSATMIGPKTAMTAAHCMYDNKVKRWNNFLSGAPAPAPAGVSHPYGYLTGGCIRWVFPSAYQNDVEAGTYDWAVMDFSACAANQNPANTVGYIGYRKSTDWTPARSDTLLVYGSPFKSFRCQWPQLCGASGTWSSVSGGFVYSTNIYVSHGQSGTSLMLSTSGNPHVGVTVGRSTDDTTTKARIFDGALYSYCKAYSDPVRFP